MKLRPVLGWKGLLALATFGRWRWVRRMVGGRWELWWCDKPIADYRWFPVDPTQPGRPIADARRRPLKIEHFHRFGPDKLRKPAA